MQFKLTYTIFLSWIFCNDMQVAFVASNDVAANMSSANSSLSSTPNNITITNYKVTTTHAADLPKVQLEEVVAKEKIIKEHQIEGEIGINLNGTAIKSRKITPTNVINDGVAAKLQQQQQQNVTKTVPNATSNNLNKTTTLVPKATTTSLNTSNIQQQQEQKLKVPPQKTKMVAEGVSIAVSNASNNEKISISKIESANETKNTNTSTKVAENGSVANITNTTQTNVVNAIPNIVSKNNSITTTTSTTTTTIAASITSTTTSTTTTTTTPKPKKPRITYGYQDFPNLQGDDSKPAAAAKLPTKTVEQTSTTLSHEPSTETAASLAIREPPNAEPSKEMSSRFPYHNERDYLVPFFTLMLTVPLAIGVVITAYRRFRDCWTTRHYRRMDFLVDGMYND